MKCSIHKKITLCIAVFSLLYLCVLNSLLSPWGLLMPWECGKRNLPDKDFEDCFLICLLFLYANRILHSSPYLCLQPEILVPIKMGQNHQLSEKVKYLILWSADVIIFAFDVRIPPPCTLQCRSTGHRDEQRLTVISPELWTSRGCRQTDTEGRGAGEHCRYRNRMSRQKVTQTQHVRQEKVPESGETTTAKKKMG